MNLQNTFPEIHDFFIREHFDADELKSLEGLILARYKEKDIYAKACSFLKLELLKFQILDQNPDQKVVNRRKSKKSPKSLLKVTDKITFPRELFNLTVKLKISRLELNQLCSSSGVDVSNSIKLNDFEIEKLLPIFQKKYNENRAKEISEYNEKSNGDDFNRLHMGGNKFQNQKSWTGGVYDLVGKYGLGKIIYIRSR